MNKNYIFKEDNGSLEFIGDFDGLYSDQDDPWNQSGNYGEIKDYYNHSRKRLNLYLSKINPVSLLEVGCGLGYTTRLIQNNLSNCAVSGLDISKVAIEKAINLFPDLRFINGNIANDVLLLDSKYNVIILNQLLWYVLESLDCVFNNCFNYLDDGGQVVISQAFLKSEQRYGKDKCDGFSGLISYLENNAKYSFKIEYHDYDIDNNLLHNDGIVVLRKIK